MKADTHILPRRVFIQTACAAACAAMLPSAEAAEQVIDIHQHTHYWGRADADLRQHQRALGVTKTVLLPAGSQYGLEADCYGNDSCLRLVKKYPQQFVFFANELPDLPETKQVLEKYLKLGALGIGEQKFQVECDSKHIELIATIARAYRVPVLLHFQHNKYNTGFERFYKVLEKFPQVNFIAHAQTWWGNIGQLKDQTDLYPQGPVVPGGLSDKWLGDYPNLYGDLSAGSGLRALLRDEEFTRGLLARHQDKLLYGSDCQDVDTQSDKCCGIRTLDTIRRLAPDKTAVRKILFNNAKRVLRII
jgi:uncharacterized protein